MHVQSTRALSLAAAEKGSVAYFKEKLLITGTSGRRRESEGRARPRQMRTCTGAVQPDGRLQHLAHRHLAPTLVEPTPRSSTWTPRRVSSAHFPRPPHSLPGVPGLAGAPGPGQEVRPGALPSKGAAGLGVLSTLPLTILSCEVSRT